MKETQKDMEASDQRWQTRAYATDREYVYRQLQGYQSQLLQENMQSPTRHADAFASSSSARPLTGYISNAATTWTPTYSRMWPDTPNYYAGSTQPPVLYPLSSASLGHLTESQDFSENHRLALGQAYSGSSKLRLPSQPADMPWPNRLLDLSAHVDGDGSGEHTGSNSNSISNSFSNSISRSQLLNCSPALVPPSSPTPMWNIPLQDLHDFHNRTSIGRAPVQRDYAPKQEALQSQSYSSLGPVGTTSSSVGRFGSFSTFGSFAYPPSTAPTAGSLRQGLSQGRQQERQTEPEARSDGTRAHIVSESSGGAASIVSATPAANAAPAAPAAPVAPAASASATSTSAAMPPWPSAPGFLPPLTGYEFELQHDANLHELQKQKQWARVQLSSCNENARFHHTQTTGCIAAVNGRIIGPYSPDSLRCYGTNPEVAGLRVTMTVHDGGGGRGSSLAAAVGASSECTSWTTAAPVTPLFDEPTLVIRHQIVVPSRRAMALASGGFGYPGQTGRRALSSPRSLPSSSASAATSTSSAGTSHQQSRRRHFATTIIPLRGGMAARPGYRPLEAAEAADRIRSWGGQPSHGVFGNAWLVRLAIEPGHVQHVEDSRAMELLAGRGLGEKEGLGGGGWLSGGQQQQQQSAASASATIECMRTVNQSMKELGRHDGTLSIMLSNHATQKRMARQCPDLVAMWVLAQENL